MKLGSADEAGRGRKAEEELANVFADVRRGVWQPPTRTPVAAPIGDTRFGSFAREWYASKGSQGLAPRTLEDLYWGLAKHILLWFTPLRRFGRNLLSGWTAPPTSSPPSWSSRLSAATETRGRTYVLGCW